MANATFVGGGPAGLAPLVRAARQGRLSLLGAGGLIVVERGERLGAGGLGRYAIGSDTLAETFLECLEHSAEPGLAALATHPAARAVAACRGGSVPLPVVSRFLDTLGEAMSAAILAAGGRIMTGCEALRSQRRGDGLWLTRVRTATGEQEILSRHLVLATGAEERRDALHTVPVAGAPLLPGCAGRLMMSGEVLGAEGIAQVARRLEGIANPTVAIVGGSHSALAAAHWLLNHGSGLRLGPDSVSLLHRRPLRVFYPSAASALADGYDDFDADDVCPVSQRLFRLAGFRLEARELVMRALRIGGRAPEPRLRLVPLARTPDAEAARVLAQADLVISALGYRPRALPVFDRDGHRLRLATDAETAGPMVDRQCRVCDGNGRPIPGLLGIGLAAGFVPSGSLGGEPSFRGQTNGIWLWQNGVGDIVIDALLHESEAHVAA